MYSRAFDRIHPGCFIVLVDQSFSMTEGVAGSFRSKMEAATHAVNRLIHDLIIRSDRGEAKIQHLLDVCILGYTTDAAGVPVVKSLLTGPLAGGDWVSLVDLYDYPLGFETRKINLEGETIEVKYPVWFRTASSLLMGGTPMQAALKRCHDIASAWCADHPDCFPPLVLHCTDGESTESDCQTAVEDLWSSGTSEGFTLLSHCLFSAVALSTAPLLFPGPETPFPDDVTEALFWLSSPMPSRLRERCEAMNLHVLPGSRMMVLNADLSGFARMLDFDSDVLAPSLEIPETREAPRLEKRVSLPANRCPRCDRKAPGPPGQRFCFICDRTF